MNQVLVRWQRADAGQGATALTTTASNHGRGAWNTGAAVVEPAEYNEVLAELKQLIICSSSQYVIIAGDFNTD